MAIHDDPLTAGLEAQQVLCADADTFVKFQAVKLSGPNTYTPCLTTDTDAAVAAICLEDRRPGDPRNIRVCSDLLARACPVLMDGSGVVTAASATVGELSLSTTSAGRFAPVASGLLRATTSSGAVADAIVLARLNLTAASGSGTGDMLLAGVQTVTGAKTFRAGTLKQNNAANTFATTIASAATAARTITFPDATGSLLTGTMTANLVPYGTAAGVLAPAVEATYGNRLYWDNAAGKGWLGVGCTGATPQYPLDVSIDGTGPIAARINSTNGADDTALLIESAGANRAAYVGFNSGGVLAWAHGIFQPSISANLYSISEYVASVKTPRLTVFPGGNINLGTATVDPGFALSVAGIEVITRLFGNGASTDGSVDIEPFASSTVGAPSPWVYFQAADGVAGDASNDGVVGGEFAGVSGAGGNATGAKRPGDGGQAGCGAQNAGTGGTNNAKGGDAYLLAGDGSAGGNGAAGNIRLIAGNKTGSGALGTIQVGIDKVCNVSIANASGFLGFFGLATPVVKQTSGANLTNSVTSGGSTDVIANYTDLSIYANDAAAIRNDIYQLAKKLKQINDGLRSYGLFT